MMLDKSRPSKQDLSDLKHRLGLAISIVGWRWANGSE
jgi:hypothetical protein